MVKKGELKLYNNLYNNNNNNNDNDKPRFWSKNRNVSNEGNDDNSATKQQQPIFNLSSKIPSNNNPENNKAKSFFSNPWRKFTNIGEPLESALKTLLANKLIVLPEARSYEPPVKPNWWNDNHFCNYHQNKGHQTNDCQRLKHLIQDLIDNGTITVDSHKTNESHLAFKTPLPNYDKGEPSQLKDDKGKAKVNYTYTYDDVVNVIIVKDNPSSEPINVITRSKEKVTFPGIAKVPTSTSQQYNLVEQLQRIPAQISILERLKVSPMHEEILEKALVETTVSKDLDIDQFQNMVGHLIAPHCLSFFENDDASLQHPHNAPLHVEVTINKTCVKLVLIDGGADLNICALSLIKDLGYS